MIFPSADPQMESSKAQLEEQFKELERLERIRREHMRELLEIIRRTGQVHHF